MKLKRYWWVLIVVLVVGFIGFRLSRKGARADAAEAQKPTYTAVTVTRGSLTTTVDGSGKITPAVTVDISSPKDGTLTALLVEAGDYVQRGQALARLDSTSTGVQLLQMQASVNEAKLNVATTKEDYERQQRLFDAQAATQQQVDAAKVKYENALDSLKVAQAQLEEMQGKAGNGSGKTTVITAPMAGVITAVNSQAGANVSSRIPFISMTDPSRLVLEAEVDENDIAQVKEGQRATITLDALPDLSCQGRVISIGGLGAESNGVVIFKVKVEFNNPGGQIKIGMNADASITIMDKRNIITVPNSVLETRMGNTVARIYERGGEISYQRVTTGMRTDSVTEILDGLKEGDRVAVAVAKVTQTSEQSSDDQRRGNRMMGFPMGR